MSEEVAMNVAATVAIMKEAEGLIDRIEAILTDKSIEGLNIEQEDMDMVNDLLDKLWILNNDCDICEYLRPTLHRIQSAELMMTMRNELEDIGIPRAEQATLVPGG